MTLADGKRLGDRGGRNRPGLVTFAASPTGGRSDHLGQRIEADAVAERAPDGSRGRVGGLCIEHHCRLHLKPVSW